MSVSKLTWGLTPSHEPPTKLSSCRNTIEKDHVESMLGPGMHKKITMLCNKNPENPRPLEAPKVSTSTTCQLQPGPDAPGALVAPSDGCWVLRGFRL